MQYINDIVNIIMLVDVQIIYVFIIKRLTKLKQAYVNAIAKMTEETTNTIAKIANERTNSKEKSGCNVWSCTVNF